MRDYVDILLDKELDEEEEFLKRCPVCDCCHAHITSTNYYYDCDGIKICDDIDCIMNFMEQFKRTIISYMEK